MMNKTNIKIPNKYAPVIKEIYEDEDGYWCELENGYYAGGTGGYDECHVIHEDTHTDILKQIRQIKRI